MLSDKTLALALNYHHLSNVLIHFTNKCILLLFDRSTFLLVLFRIAWWPSAGEELFITVWWPSAGEELFRIAWWPSAGEELFRIASWPSAGEELFRIAWWS